MISQQKIGERLCEAMFEMNNMSSAQFSELIGVTVQTVNRWKRGERLMQMSSLIAAADILKCTMDFLVCRNDKPLDFLPQKCPPFYGRLRGLMLEHNISWYKLTKETSIKDSYLYMWKKGSDTKIPALVELADYFDISLDFLVGRER